MQPFEKRAGFTMVEALISAVLVSVVIMGLGMAVHQGTELFRQSTANSEIEGRLDRAITRVQRTLLGASTISLSPDLTSPVGGPVVWSDALEYQPAIDWVGEVVVLGPTTRIEFRLGRGEFDNGVDDDDDGLIDEGSVVRIDDLGQPDAQEVVLANGVSELLEGELANGLDDNGNGLIDERGLVFDLDGDTLNVRLTLARPGPSGALIERTHVASIVLRN